MDFEVDKCQLCGKSLRDYDPLENDNPVSLEKGKELCSSCYQNLIDQETE
ncbi:hypothetical protein [Dehalobacterium formicoaceticum]|uniref:LIM zinc-binding domain-containing protein n=1 Tax=Dehalobacterium formicoaceticum TaxID=51515 RepID=A0ABT1Y3E5_9FIRM|nr:hypothetical protein [Dehalobacterium formicoaceticum]MCR6545392.1 hypothetical protein [Dehalobacterium formicoaceticum]